MAHAAAGRTSHDLETVCASGMAWPAERRARTVRPAAACSAQAVRRQFSAKIQARQDSNPVPSVPPADRAGHKISGISVCPRQGHLGGFGCFRKLSL